MSTFAKSVFCPMGLLCLWISRFLHLCLFSSAVLKLYGCYLHGLSSSGAVKELVQVSFLLSCNSHYVEKHCSIPIVGRCLGPERGRRWLFLDHRVSHLKETKPFPALTLQKESQGNILLTLRRLGRSRLV